MSIINDNLSYKMCMATIEHPIVYANFLIEVGYEPPKNWICTISQNCKNEAKVGTPLFVRYINYIYKTEGLAGLANGLQPRLCLCLISNFAEKKVESCFSNSDGGKDKSRIVELLETTAKRMLSRAIAVALSHPFYVISLRTMAQFIGKENKYTGIWNPLTIVYNEQGIKGLYAGFTPRLLREITHIILTSSAVFAIKMCFMNNERPRNRNSAISITHEIISMYVRNLTYPLHVISACMAVNDFGLKAGCPPQMPIFSSWLDCWNYLSSTSQLNKGWFPIWRYERLPNRYIKVPLIPCNTCCNEPEPNHLKNLSSESAEKESPNLNEDYIDDVNEDFFTENFSSSPE